MSYNVGKDRLSDLGLEGIRKSLVLFKDKLDFIERRTENQIKYADSPTGVQMMSAKLKLENLNSLRDFYAELEEDIVKMANASSFKEFTELETKVYNKCSALMVKINGNFMSDEYRQVYGKVIPAPKEALPELNEVNELVSVIKTFSSVRGSKLKKIEEKEFEYKTVKEKFEKAGKFKKAFMILTGKADVLKEQSNKTR